MLTPARTAVENADNAAVYARPLGFRPAFLDTAQMRIYPALFADGTAAPFHCLDGLPEEAVADRLHSGRVVRAKATLIAGFERGGFFFTRRAAARACEQWPTVAS